ncbi:MAG: hypothetical protein LBN21_08090, partial [Treponema sp.]|nr:hypothetical protein [Treponema sp.]
MKKIQSVFLCVLTAASLAFLGCENPFEPEASGGDDAAVVSALDLTSLVTAPVKNTAPLTAEINHDQYTGTILWEKENGNKWAAFEGDFEPATMYRAIVTLSAKEGFTFKDLAANSFTYSGALTVSNNANTGKVTINFKPTAAETASTVINAFGLDGYITAPVTGAVPSAAEIDRTQYTGTIVWQKDGEISGVETFEAAAVYKAVITLNAKTGFTFTGVDSNSFTFSGAAVTNAAGTGTGALVTVTFPATAAMVNALGLADILVLPLKDAVPVVTIDSAQYTGAILWSPAADVFAASTAYTAVITLTAKPGFTFTGLTEDNFTYPGAASVTITANTGSAATVAIIFPATGAAIVSDFNLSGLVTAPAKGAVPST